MSYKTNKQQQNKQILKRIIGKDFQFEALKCNYVNVSWFVYFAPTPASEKHLTNFIFYGFLNVFIRKEVFSVFLIYLLNIEFECSQELLHRSSKTEYPHTMLYAKIRINAVYSCNPASRVFQGCSLQMLVKLTNLFACAYTLLIRKH